MKSLAKPRIVFPVIILLFIVLTMYSFYLPTTVFQIGNSLNVRPVQDLPLRHFEKRRCRNVLLQMRQGSWRKRSDISERDNIQRNEQDSMIREARGLPRKLHRTDNHCGTKFPLSAPGFGYTVPSLCNATGSSPCCSEALGLCGASQQHCSCGKDCTDFRKILSAEQCDWVPSSGCHMRNFTSETACKLMSERISSLVLIGDSLMRHFHNALMILFTNDPLEGALRADLDNETRTLCAGEMQFVDSGKSNCHGKTTQKISDLAKEKFCRGSYDFDYYFNEAYSLQYSKRALAEVKQRLKIKNSVIVMGVGLHMDFNAEVIMAKYVEPMLHLREKEGGNTTWPQLIWVTVHAHGSLKPLAFRSSQGNDKVAQFNDKMRQYLEPRGVKVFDTFDLTRGIHSYDGTHYGVGVNMLKAQLLMNFLEETMESKDSESKTRSS